MNKQVMSAYQTLGVVPGVSLENVDRAYWITAESLRLGGWDEQSRRNLQLAYERAVGYAERMSSYPVKITGMRMRFMSVIYFLVISLFLFSAINFWHAYSGWSSSIAVSIDAFILGIFTIGAFMSTYRLAKWVSIQKR